MELPNRAEKFLTEFAESKQAFFKIVGFFSVYSVYSMNSVRDKLLVIFLIMAIKMAIMDKKIILPQRRRGRREKMKKINLCELCVSAVS